MTGADVIVEALAAGAAAGITEGTTGVVGDAYRGLWQGLRARFSRENIDVVVPDPPGATDEAAWAEWKEIIRRAVAESGASTDDGIRERAAHSLTLIENCQGVMQGNNNTQNNTWSQGA